MEKCRGGDEKEGIQEQVASAGSFLAELIIGGVLGGPLASALLDLLRGILGALRAEEIKSEPLNEFSKIRV